MQLIDLSHEIHDGLVTYPGLASPRIRPDMSYEESRSHYAPGYEFQIDRIEMVANTGTYLDTPAHRIRGGWDLAGLDLAKVAGLEVVVVDSDDTTIQTGICRRFCLPSCHARGARKRQRQWTRQQPAWLPTRSGQA